MQSRAAFTAQCNGDYLATGCYDGVARIWDCQGNLVKQLAAHQGPIFALKWNCSGSRVLSAGVDNVRVQLSIFALSALDHGRLGPEHGRTTSVPLPHPVRPGRGLDQRRHVRVLLGGQADPRVSVRSGRADEDVQGGCGGREPASAFQGHVNEVNAVKYDRVSGLLASCSDDRTLKVWSLDKEKPVFDVVAHDKEIYTIRWSPAGHYLASASFDHSVKIWDLQRNTCARQLQKHSESVYTVAFSPEGTMLASGSFDKTINIWDLRVSVFLGVFPFWQVLNFLGLFETFVDTFSVILPV